QLGGSPETNIGNMDKEEREENRSLWKSKVGYNRRWLIEIIISAFKRMFGDHMHSRNCENMVQEIKLRVALYNKW
ncbi:MAG: transposase, partial [Thaumarchaeota archaeon]|nr:transposase [Nitrososphaerota archaeon]